VIIEIIEIVEIVEIVEKKCNLQNERNVIVMLIRYEFSDGQVIRSGEFESDGMDVAKEIIIHASEQFPSFISAATRGSPRPRPRDIATNTLKGAGVTSIDYWTDGTPGAKPIHL